MDCPHTTARIRFEGEESTKTCTRCNEVIQEEVEVDWEARSLSARRAAAVQDNRVGPVDDLELDGYLYRGEERTRSNSAEERNELKRCAEMRDAERHGGKLREVDGLRHTMSIPSEAYWAGKRKYGDNFMQDPKIKAKYKKAFSVTADR